MPEFDDKIAPLPQRVRAVRRNYGYLYIIQHRNYGDVQWESPIEPSFDGTKISIGTDEAAEIEADTRCVVLFATFRCRAAFVPDHSQESAEAIEARAFPIAQDTEVTRILPMNTPMRIVTFPDY